MRRRASSPRHAAWMDTAALMRTSKPSRCSTMRHHACSFKAAVWEGQHAHGGNQQARLQSDESTSNTKKHEPYTTVRYQRDSEGNVCVSGQPAQKSAQSLYLHLCKSLPGTNAPPQRLDQGGGCAVHVEVRLARKHAPGGLNDRCSEIPDLRAQEGRSTDQANRQSITPWRRCLGNDSGCAMIRVRTSKSSRTAHPRYNACSLMASRRMADRAPRVVWQK